MRQLIFRRIALAELRAIGKSTKVRWDDEQAALKVGELRNRNMSLRQFPLRFAEFDGARPGMRKMNCGHHVVFYLVTDEHIEIIRILHEAMDFDGRIG